MNREGVENKRGLFEQKSDGAIIQSIWNGIHSVHIETANINPSAFLYIKWTDSDLNDIILIESSI